MEPAHTSPGMLLYARICSRAPHPAESRGIFGRPPSLAPGSRRRPGPATRGHGPSERDLPKDLGLSEVEAEASACLDDVRSLQAEVREWAGRPTIAAACGAHASSHMYNTCGPALSNAPS